jgi:hypothetical protein
MAASWEVEAALQEVLASIEQGSALPLTQVEKDELVDFYLPAFRAQHDRGADWGQDKAQILPLATLVGMAATLFTSVKVTLTAGGPPTQVDPESALQAASAIALQCQVPEVRGEGGARMDDDLKPLGPYCPRPVPGTLGAGGDDLAISRRLWELLKLLRAAARPH